jgi:hypothetical protein
MSRDLLIPASTGLDDKLAGMLDGWTGPILRYWPEDDEPEETVSGVVLPRRGREIEFLSLDSDDIESASIQDLRLDPRRPEVRDLLRRVLAHGERCPQCGGPQPSLGPPGGWPVEVRCKDEQGGCDGTGWRRPPHRLGWITDAEESGVIAEWQAAVIWWCCAERVRAGLTPIVRVERISAGIAARERKLQTGVALLDADGSITVPLSGGRSHRVESP